MLYFHLSFFFTFCVFLYIIVYILDITIAVTNMPINEIKDFIFGNYYKRIGLDFKEIIEKKKDLLLLANKLMENILDPRNAKEHYQSFIIKKKRKSVKQSQIITYKPTTFDIVDIKSVITEHSKTSNKLSKSIRQAENLGSNSSLHSDTKKVERF